MRRQPSDTFRHGHAGRANLPWKWTSRRGPHFTWWCDLPAPSRVWQGSTRRNLPGRPVATARVRQLRGGARGRRARTSVLLVASHWAPSIGCSTSSRATIRGLRARALRNRLCASSAASTRFSFRAPLPLPEVSSRCDYAFSMRDCLTYFDSFTRFWSWRPCLHWRLKLNWLMYSCVCYSEGNVRCYLVIAFVTCTVLYLYSYSEHTVQNCCLLTLYAYEHDLLINLLEYKL